MLGQVLGGYNSFKYIGIKTPLTYACHCATIPLLTATLMLKMKARETKNAVVFLLLIETGKYTIHYTESEGAALFLDVAQYTHG